MADEKTDFTALMNLMNSLRHYRHQTREEAIQACRSEGHWTERDIQSAAHLVYDYDM